MNFDLRLGDCLDPVTGLASLKDKSIDHVITDPPYGEHVHSCSRQGHTGGDKGREAFRKTRKEFSRKKDLGFDCLTNGVRDSSACEFSRLTKRWVLCFSDIEGAHYWNLAGSKAGMTYIRTGLWIKISGTPQFTGDRPGIPAESIVIFHNKGNGRMRWNGGGRPGLWSEKIVLDRGSKEYRVHTTQKPENLMEALVRDFTDPGDLVCDPFAGSGTTGVACLRLGRRFIGWERDPEYHAVAIKRLQATREQLGLIGIGA